MKWWVVSHVAKEMHEQFERSLSKEHVVEEYEKVMLLMIER